MNGLRLKLREDTKDAHTRLDQALIKYDLTTLSGLTSYLSVHYLARLHLSEILVGYEYLRDESARLDDLRLDFSTLCVRPPRWETGLINVPQHPLGLIYVMAGSSLGGKILYKNWSATPDPLVKSANHFVTNSKDSEMWTRFLAYIQTEKFSDQETNRIVKSANYCFEVFEAANEQMKDKAHV